MESVKKIGQEFSVPVVDAWNAMEGSSSNRGKYLPDGLHLNAKYESLSLSNFIHFQINSKIFLSLYTVATLLYLMLSRIRFERIIMIGSQKF